MAQIDLFKFESYKSYVLDRIAASPKKGRGELARIAETTGVHKTTLSQIFRGDKDLSLEQALKLAQHWSLSQLETEYFVLLVDFSRAGSHELRLHFEAQLLERRTAHQRLESRVTRSRALSSEERAIYYSTWIYSAIRNLTAIEGTRSLPALAKRLRLPIGFLDRALGFLLETGLCVQKDGILGPGPQMTHLGAESPLVARHHGNWRVKAMDRHPVLRTDDELAYTAPMTLSAQDVLRVRAVLADVIGQVDQIVGPSPSEKLYCLNVDWFEV